jgi:Protein of unknown function (DUF2934)
MTAILEKQPYPKDGGSPNVKLTTSRPRRTKRVPTEAPRPESLHATPEEEIRRRAYEIFLERGAEPGDALSDWLQAERELRKSLALSWRMASSRT